jgi:WhiB family redox-sensing transcriptional regulator
MTLISLPLLNPGGDWHESALCAQTDPDAFYPEKGDSARDSKRVCLGCPVRKECLEDALRRQEQWGIWGGLSPQERKGLLKGRAA